jgi:hypothetical protein
MGIFFFEGELYFWIAKAKQQEVTGDGNRALASILAPFISDRGSGHVLAGDSVLAACHTSCV